jgi:hypothetical protein
MDCEKRDPRPRFSTDRMPGQFQLLGEKADQRCGRFFLSHRCAQFDLNGAAMLAGVVCASTPVPFWILTQLVLAFSEVEATAG